MIEIKHITKSYQTKQGLFKAVDDVSLTIKDGVCLGIVGYSGAGKSTLVRMINKLIKPNHGEVIFQHEDLLIQHRRVINRMRHNIGMIFQHFNLLASLTVYQNVALALKIAKYPKAQIANRVDEVLDLVGLQDKKNSYPKNLSGGQKQRVGIARAIVNHPKYLLCDEITSALDYKTALEIINVIRNIKLHTQMTIIFISHQMDLVSKICDEVVVMSEGKIVEKAPTKELFFNPKHEVTKSLLSDLIDYVDDKDTYRLIYSEEAKEEAIISEVISIFNVRINILFGKTVEIGLKRYGILHLNITGKDIEDAIQYIKRRGIDIERQDGV